mmetsp:Transcript_51246/g.122822  ORF Transcript_51246/g.122822 Transcript_51246/m.122822 type:complete len:284 (+) Transcript_51246:74-925(+)|eukprot:CAMPEP_0181468476 /NCGR_PEP_ID=MMETSP1110-20121109/37510_1 /TAXON_ID=174948 /ORGANISM="Symbiodinium sp., Strain CCMP421" /LENGTH=283 /DNA_ID=CAMNT_0023593327 /DNA_START=52 /DNA_END=903 /DNA_ORIENTATION=-
MDKRSPGRKVLLGVLLVLALRLVTSQGGNFGLVFTVGRPPCQHMQARRALCRAVSEAVEEAVDISEEAPEDAENSELMYPLYSRTERSMTVNGEGTKWWPLTKTASSILAKEGEVQLDCLGAISVYYGTEIAWLLGEWNNGTSGTFRRLGAALAVRPDLLADPAKGYVRMRLHVAPVKVPEAALQDIEIEKDVLKAPSKDGTTAASSALQRLVEERGAVAIQGVGAESVNRIMKAIFRANQRISQTEGATSDVLWALLSRVELPEKDGKINTARRLTVFKAPL